MIAKIRQFADWVFQWVTKFSISRLQIAFMFFVLGFILLLAPIFGISIPLPAYIGNHANPITELIGGNYTNIMSAGVSLLTLAAALKISDSHKELHKKIDKLSKNKEKKK
jgi:hypothetical protein